MSSVRLAFPALALSLAGCTLIESASQLFTSPSGMTEPELRDRIESFSDRFARVIRGASDSVGRASTDTATQKAVHLWKMNIIGEMREAAGRSDPRAALSDCWTLCVQLRRYFEEPPEEAAPAWTSAVEARALVLQIVREQEAGVREIGLEWLGKRRFEVAGDDIEAFAAVHPIRGRFGRLTYDRPMLAGTEFPRVDAIVSATLSPFNVVGGIDRTTQAIHEFSGVADRFTSVVQALPELARWETQLALYDFEERPTVVATRRDLAALVETTAEFVEVARSLPAALERTLASTLEGAEPASRSLRETAAVTERTVASARGLVADLEAPLARTETVLAGAGAASDGLARAGTAWEGVFRAIDDLASDDEEAPDAAEEKPFDVNEYGAAADRVGAAAAELRAGIAELRALIDGADVERVTAAVDASTETALRRTSESAVDVVDHAALRAAQLLGLAFVLGVGFALLTRRWK